MNIPSTKPYFPAEAIDEILEDVRDILASGRLILGKYADRFESEFSQYCGVNHAVAVSSATAALEIALRYFNVKDKEVIVPTNTFVASANAVFFAGGKPVLADIRKDTLCISPDDIRNRVTDRTSGVIVVHIAGMPCPDIYEIQSICKERGLFLLEDVAHAAGASIDNKKTGSFGYAGCFSFYPTKVMTSCTGGILTTNDDELAEYARSLRHHGVGQNITVGGDLREIINLGNDWLMDEVRAAIGLNQFNHLEENLCRRNKIADAYMSDLADVTGLTLFCVSPNIKHSYYKFPILLSETVDKEQFVHQMKVKYGVNIGSVYDPPVHQQALYKKILKGTSLKLPVADEILKRVACLPVYPQMQRNEIKHVIKSVKGMLKSL